MPSVSSSSEPASRPSTYPSLDQPSFRFGAILVLVAAAILYFTRLGMRALWSSEFRWAEIAREMLLTRNYFWPTINGHVYYDKPLGSYWLVTLSTPFTGGMNETAARLPCAIAGLLAVAFLMLLARRLYDSRTAILSGFILATSFSFVFFSRHASADVETLTGELAALLLFERNQDRAGGFWIIWLWLIMAATSLTKGLLGFALPLLVIGAFSCLQDGWRALASNILRGPLRARLRWLVAHNRCFFNWYSIPAIVLGIAVYYAPFEISSRLMGSEKGLQMVYRENVVRFFHPFDHRGPIYLYVYVIFALMAPWSALLPAALIETHHLRRAGDEPARSDRFALVYFWATFLFFTLSGSRRSYYLLPILPAAAILVARMLVFPGELRSKFAYRLLVIGYAVIAIAAVFGIAMLLPASMVLPGQLSQLPRLPDQFVFVIFWIIALAGVVYAIRKFSPARIAVSMGVIAYLVLAYIYVFAMPAAEAYRGEKYFALAVLNKTRNRLDQLAMFRTQGPLFYLNPPKPLPAFQKKQDLLDAIQNGGVRWFIARRRDVPQLDLPATVELSEASYPWETDYDRRNKVQLIKVEPAPPPKP